MVKVWLKETTVAVGKRRDMKLLKLLLEQTASGRSLFNCKMMLARKTCFLSLLIINIIMPSSLGALMATNCKLCVPNIYFRTFLCQINDA